MVNKTPLITLTVLKKLQVALLSFYCGYFVNGMAERLGRWTLRATTDGKLGVRYVCIVCWRRRGCSQAVCLNMASLSAR